ncbi:MAG: efflux RND transporter periplasmic adaptor subunit, partial [Pseudomonadota bacterium]
MNYTTTITADAAEPLPTEAHGAMTERATLGSGLKPVLWVGAIIIALLLAIAAYFALAGGDPGPVADDASQAPVVTVIAPGRTTV